MPSFILSIFEILSRFLLFISLSVDISSVTFSLSFNCICSQSFKGFQSKKIRQGLSSFIEIEESSKAPEIFIVLPSAQM
jgi:hypothetical protein